MIKKEEKLGISRISFYKKFRGDLKKLIASNRNFFKNNKSKVIGYGAAAKATIFCNVLKLNRKNIKFIVDKNKFKQNRQIPGTDIDITDDSYLIKNPPNYLLIFLGI